MTAYSDYEGQIKCYTCSALLEVKLEEGLIKSLQFLMVTGRATPDYNPDGHFRPFRRHSREGGNPDGMQVIAITGFPFSRE